MQPFGFFENLKPVFTAAPVMYNIESGAQDLELEFVAYDAGSIANLSCDICPDVNDSFANQRDGDEHLQRSWLNDR